MKSNAIDYSVGRIAVFMIGTSLKKGRIASNHNHYCMVWAENSTITCKVYKRSIQNTYEDDSQFTPEEQLE